MGRGFSMLFRLVFNGDETLANEPNNVNRVFFDKNVMTRGFQEPHSVFLLGNIQYSLIRYSQ